MKWSEAYVLLQILQIIFERLSSTDPNTAYDEIILSLIKKEKEKEEINNKGNDEENEEFEINEIMKPLFFNMSDNSKRVGKKVSSFFLKNKSRLYMPSKLLYRVESLHIKDTLISLSNHPCDLVADISSEILRKFF